MHQELYYLIIGFLILLIFYNKNEQLTNVPKVRIVIPDDVPSEMPRINKLREMQKVWNDPYARNIDDWVHQDDCGCHSSNSPGYNPKYHNQKVYHYTPLFPIEDSNFKYRILYDIDGNKHYEKIE